MTRRLLNLLTALSLLVCVAVAALSTSGWTSGRSDGWQWAGQEPAGDGKSVRLRVSGMTVDRRAAELTRIDVRTTPSIASSLLPGLSRSRSMMYGNLGMGLRRFAPGSFMLRVPVWLVVGLTAVPPAFGYVRRRRGRKACRRSALGLCPSCGYDLTANVRGVCPECGTPGRYL